MKTTSRKVISILLSIVMALAALPMASLPAFAGTSGDFSYMVVTDKTCYITDYTGSATEVTIPSEIDGYTVTSIDGSAFADCTSLTSVTIPDSVKSIGVYAFYGCSSLESVVIPEGVPSSENAP